MDFKEGATVLGTGTFSTTGGVTTATFTTSSLTLGSHAIKAVYGGDSNFASATSPTLTQVVKVDSATTVASSVNPSASGQSVSFVATVSTSGSGTPTGTVTFMDGTTTLGTGTLSTTAGVTTATFATSSLGSGSHDITAVYGGDTTFVNSTSPILVQTVSGAATATVASSANPSGQGQSVTFTATVSSSSSGTPTGTVTFMDGSTTLGTGTLSTTAGVTTATFATSSLTLGSHTITAVYGGDSAFASATSPVLTQVVELASTTTIASSANPSGSGQSVTFTATVNVTGSGTPTGTVTFADGGTTLGTAAISTTAGVTTATFSTSSLSVGGHPITATYNGDSTFAGSTSPILTQSVQSATTTSVTSSVNPSSDGQGVTFTATVTSSASGTPGGTLTFFDGGASIGNGTLDTTTGKWTLMTSSLSVGSHAITAVYAGDSNFAGSTSPTLTQVVNVSTTTSTTTTLGSSANPSGAGTTVTFTATVSPSGSGTPTGTVTFMDGAATLGTGTLGTSGGQTTATFSTSSLATGSHNITAVYGGDSSFTGSTSGTLVQVVAVASSTAISSSQNPSNSGDPVTFTATVTTSGSGTPTGTVTFTDGGSTLGTTSLSTSGGVTTATFTTSSLSVGSHSITATYNGDSTFGSSSSTLTQDVNVAPTKANTSAGVASTVFAPNLGDPVTFVGYVFSNGSTNPTGTVTFKDGTFVLGTGTVSTSGGQTTATFTTSSLASGSHGITAVYNGDSTYNGSVSPVLTQNVIAPNLSASSTGVASSVFAPNAGDPVTFTAFVSGSGSTPPGGTVTFFDGGNVLGTGTVTNSGGQTTATFTTSSLAVGTHSITAVYAGDGNYNGSTSPVLTQNVNAAQGKVTTSTGVASSILNPAVGQSVTFTAFVNGSGATPTGSVTFFDGSTVLGGGSVSTSGGQTTASFTTSSLGAGSHNITAVYAGDSTHSGSTSPTLHQNVNATAKNDTTTGVASSILAPGVGDQVTFTAFVSGSGSTNPGGTVTFLDGGTVLGTGTLSTSNGQTTATFSTSSLAIGDHDITAVYEGDGTFNGSTSPVLVQTVSPHGRGT